MKQNIIIAMLTFIIFTLLRREQRQPQIVASVPQQPHKDRTLEELSPTYAKEVAENRTIFDYAPEKAHAFVRQFVDELVREDLTPVERERVKKQLAQLFFYGRTYDREHAAKLEEQSQIWLDNLEEQSDEF